MAFLAPPQTHPVIVSTSWSFALCTPSPLERASVHAMLLSQPRDLYTNLHFGSVSLPSAKSHFHMNDGYFQLGVLLVIPT